MSKRSLQQDLITLAEGLLRSIGRSYPAGNTLEIHHTAAPQLNPDLFRNSPRETGLFIKLNKGNAPDFDQPIVCKTSKLPFADHLFSLVVMNHVVSDGTELELEEAVRLLARDGLLVILGVNRLGWRFQFQGTFRRLPGISPLKVRSRLARLEMNMQGFAGAGLLGRMRPVFMSSGLAGLGSPIADVVLLQARHCGGPEMTPLTRPGVVQSA
jgi:SAM-dependent methyltransferase